MDYYIKKNDAVSLLMKEAKSHGLSFSAEAYERAANLTACMPNEDVQPVVHGRWIISSDGYYPYCSECKERPEGKPTKFCPNCGARLIGGEG